MERKELHNLIDRYFEGNTAPREERRLLRECLSLRGRDRLADETLAVMGMARVREYMDGRKKSRQKAWRVAAVAAAAACVCAVGFSYMAFREGAVSHASECYAFVDGVRVDNRTVVDALMLSQLEEVGRAGEGVEELISEDISDIRDAINIDML